MSLNKMKYTVYNIAFIFNNERFSITKTVITKMIFIVFMFSIYTFSVIITRPTKFTSAIDTIHFHIIREE